MRAAEDSLMGQNRVAELMKYAGNTGVKRIGIAHCVGMTREAMELKSRLEEKFEVYTVDCKYGKIHASEMHTMRRHEAHPAIRPVRLIFSKKTTPI